MDIDHDNLSSQLLHDEWVDICTRCNKPYTQNEFICLCGFKPSGKSVAERRQELDRVLDNIARDFKSGDNLGYDKNP